MHPGILYLMRDRLNLATGAQSNYPIAGGIEWAVIDPKLSRLNERVTYSRSGGTGVIWRSGSNVKNTSRGLQGEARVTLATYFASMEVFAYEGEYLLLEEQVDQTLRSLGDARFGLEHAWLTGIEEYNLEGAGDYTDVLVVAYSAMVRYVTPPAATNDFGSLRLEMEPYLP